MSAINVLIDDAVFEKAISEAPAETLRFIEKTMKSSALLVQNTAKELAPKDTGQLRRSITSKVTSSEAQIGSGLVYAPIQEYGGTIKAKGKYLRFKSKAGNWVMTPKVVIKAQPYLEPALKKNTKKIIDKFDGLAKAINLK